jgi:hypothetical protein
MGEYKYEGKTGYIGVYKGQDRYRNKYAFNWHTTFELLWGLVKVPARVLDYGCGAGSLGFIGRDDKNMLIVDGYDPMANEWATHHDRDELKGVYDLIICKDVLEHLSYEAVCEMLQWSSIHCKKLCIVLPNHHAAGIDFWEDMTHVRPYDTHHFPAYLEANGWTVERVVYSNRYMWWQMPFAFVLSFKRVLRGGVKSILQGCFQDYVIVASSAWRVV